LSVKPRREDDELPLNMFDGADALLACFCSDDDDPMIVQIMIAAVLGATVIMAHVIV
jgi:hypothetical protein